MESEKLLTRKEIAVALTAAGFPVKSTTLSTMATRGKGPDYRKFGQRPLYRLADALAWAHNRLSEPVASSSELRVVSHRTAAE
jgi:hypothetical protein